MYSRYDVSGLTVDQIARRAPSIMAERPYSGGALTERYVFLPTIEPVKALIAEGWEPFEVFENKVRKDDKHGFQKHMIRFRHRNAISLFNGVDFNMLLTNSHDGTSAYKLMCALFRMVCGNGLIAVDKELEAMAVRHSGRKTIDDVVEASYRIIENAPLVANAIESMSAQKLTESERIAFARASLELRWQSEEREAVNGQVEVVSTAPIKAETLLKVRRNGDMATDTFTTLNVVQEHLIRGGDYGRNANGGATTTREVKSVTESTKLNRALWVLAREMEKLKG